MKSDDQSTFNGGEIKRTVDESQQIHQIRPVAEEFDPKT